MINVNVVRRKWIKPCIPTPQNLKNYSISFIDETSPTMNVGVLLFYSSRKTKQNLTSQLEESLSKILVQFYPLAGRYIKNDHLVDCSDQGAEYVEAEAPDIELINIVRETTTEQLNDLLPRQSHQVDAAAAGNPPLSIQVTEFKCGGLAIGISISHRIFDASSIGTFVAAWSNASNQEREGEMAIIPTFDLPGLLPCRSGKDDLGSDDPDTPSGTEHHNRIVVKRFSFNREAITALRSKLRPNDDGGGVVISRVRVVCALIAKALIRVDLAKHGKPRACIINQAVNMRGRTIPPLPKHSCGNLVLQSVSRCIAAAETEDMGIQDVVHILGDAIKKTMADCAEILSLGENGRNIVTDPWAKMVEKSESGEVNVIWFSDWSKFGFYEADFGWGKPVWAGIGAVAGENLAVLMDDKDGGIEAWLHLKHKDMTYFEEDDLIKLFTS